MNKKYDYKQSLIIAKKKVKRIKLFYIHFIGYIVLVALILYNFYIIEDGEYKKAIIWLNITTLVAWTIFIALHGWSVFKGWLFFKKSWEDRKIEEYIEADKVKTTFWE